MNAPTEQIGIDFSTEPADSAQRCEHRTGEADRSSTESQSPEHRSLSTFFMAAMPAMGMAAMRDVATLSDKGNGVYEGPLELQSGGTWQVTITAQRGGQTIADETVERQRDGRHVMISRIIEWCERNRFLVFTGAILLSLAGALVPAARSSRRASRHQRRAGDHSHGMGGRASKRHRRSGHLPDCFVFTRRAAGQGRSRPDDVWRFLRLCRL